MTCILVGLSLTLQIAMSDFFAKLLNCCCTGYGSVHARCCEIKLYYCIIYMNQCTHFSVRRRSGKLCRVANFVAVCTVLWWTIRPVGIPARAVEAADPKGRVTQVPWPTIIALHGGVNILLGINVRSSSARVWSTVLNVRNIARQKAQVLRDSIHQYNINITLIEKLNYYTLTD